MKKSAQLGRTDNGSSFHQLFAPIAGVSPSDFAPEPIWKIFLTRFDTTGPVQALRPFGPEELTDNAAIFARFGGGTYELVARRENGTIYAKRQVTLPGDSKSMTGEGVPAQPNGASVPGAMPVPVIGAPGASLDPTQMILAFVMQQNQAAQQMQLGMMTMLGQVMVAAMTGKQGDASDTAKLVAETMRSTIDMVKANAPPPAAPINPYTAAKEMFEIARMINPPPKPPPPPPPKEETAGDVIKALADGLSPFVQMAISAATTSAAKQLAPAAAAVVSAPMG
jgi:hypothetical protein